MLKNSIQDNFQNTMDFASQGLLPDPFTIQNYAQLFGVVDPAYETLEYRVITWMFNSVVAAVVVTAFLIIFSAMAGYCFAKRDFIGKKVLYAVTIAILMVPPYVQVIPLYLELSRLGFVGTLLGVILPFLIQPFSVFLCTEFMRGIPDDYLEAARLDGYSEIQIFFRVVLPLSIPVLSVMVIINFIANWNAFIWPLLLLDSGVAGAPMLRTMPLGMFRINAELQEEAGVILALATIIIIPIFIILFLLQDYIKKGVTVEGLKG
jgi:multiple sugar transport system permease protein